MRKLRAALIIFGIGATAVLWSCASMTSPMAYSKDQVFGYIDTSGKLAFPARFHEATDFSEGLAAVRTVKRIDAQWHYIDKTGAIRFSCEPAVMRVLGFSEGLAGAQKPVVEKQRTHDSISTSVSRFHGPNQGESEDGALWGFIDPKGIFVIQPKFESVGPFKFGLAPIMVARKWGYIDKSGKIVIEPQYESANDFSEGVAAVEKNGKYGFIDTTGATKIPFNYIMVDDGFKEKVAAVNDGDWFPIDQTGANLANGTKYANHAWSSDKLYPTHSKFPSAPPFDSSKKIFVVHNVGNHIFFNKRIKETKSLPFGFFKEDGTLAFALAPELRHEDLSMRPFADGISSIVTGEQFTSSHQPAIRNAFLCDKGGKLTKVKCESFDLSNFSEGMAKVVTTQTFED